MSEVMRSLTMSWGLGGTSECMNGNAMYSSN